MKDLRLATACVTTPFRFRITPYRAEKKKKNKNVYVVTFSLMLTLNCLMKEKKNVLEKAALTKKS